MAGMSWTGGVNLALGNLCRNKKGPDESGRFPIRRSLSPGDEFMNSPVVGQKVWMRSGEQLQEGTVIGIFDDLGRIEVEPSKPEQMWASFNGRWALHFYENGQSCGVWILFGDNDGVEWDPRPVPWELV